MNIWVKRILAFMLLGVVTLLIAWLLLDRPVPTGEGGSEADTLAQRMLTAINHRAWLETGAITWNFDGRQQHLWDRKRQFARVRWHDVEVLVDLSKKSGIAIKNGRRVEGEEAVRLVAKGWEFWVNDSFWLNPLSKSFDAGTRRERVGEDLLVHFSSGGVTPGDAYLWTVGEGDLPKAWRMWVSIIPLGGLRATWEDWRTLPTGVKVASKHKILGFSLHLSEMNAAPTLADLEPGPDPFQLLTNLNSEKTTIP